MADYEFNPGEIITAVNRSQRSPVEWRFNGIQFHLKPGEERPMNLTYALYGIRRNPVMGTFDPTYEHQHQSLIGIREKAEVYPCEPIEQSEAIEAIDRSKLPAERQNATVQKVGWEGQDRQLAGRANLSEDAGFSGVMADK
jgi:hypothetical protein